MTVTDTPTHRAGPDEAQLLFEEARQRRKRRRSVACIVIVVLLVGIAIVVSATRSATHSPGPVNSASPARPLGADGASGSSFSIRQVLCYAPPFAVPPGQSPSAGPLPACSPSTRLTVSNLQVYPGLDGHGYSTNANILPDPRFATYPSTRSSSNLQAQDVLLPGTRSRGSSRYVLGPVGLGRDAIAGVRVTEMSGQWVLDVSLTAEGSVEWDALAQKTFHEMTGVVVNDRVVSAPIMQPTQSSFTSFDGQLQISGGFSEQQAKAMASEL